MGNCSLDMGLMHHFSTKHITKHNTSCHGRKGYTWAALRHEIKKKKVMLVFVDILMAQ